MIRRFVFNPFVLLLLLITAILINCSHSSPEQGRAITCSSAPYLIFSTYLGGSTPCQSCDNALTFAQNTASDSLGNTYVTGATQVSDLPVPNAWQPQPGADSTM